MDIESMTVNTKKITKEELIKTLKDKYKGTINKNLDTMAFTTLLDSVIDKDVVDYNRVDCLKYLIIRAQNLVTIIEELAEEE